MLEGQEDVERREGDGGDGAAHTPRYEGSVAMIRASKMATPTHVANGIRVLLVHSHFLPVIQATQSDQESKRTRAASVYEVVIVNEVRGLKRKDSGSKASLPGVPHGEA